VVELEDTNEVESISKDIIRRNLIPVAFSGSWMICKGGLFFIGDGVVIRQSDFVGMSV
jgi:hypothetical protein